VLNGIVGTGPVTGQHLVDLFQSTEASQVVCAIALARRLTCTGAIMLTTGTRTPLCMRRSSTSPASTRSRTSGAH